MPRLPLQTARFLVAASFLCNAVPVAAQSNVAARVQAIRFWSFGDVTRIAIQTQGEYKLFSDQIDKPARVYFDLTGIRPPAGGAHHGVQTIAIRDQLVKEVRVAEVSPGTTRVVVDLQGPADVVSSQLVNPDRLMIELRRKTETKQPLSVARSTTGSQKIDLSSSNANSASQIRQPAGWSSSRTSSRPEQLARNSSRPIVVVENSASKLPDVGQAEPSGEQVTPGHSVTNKTPPQVPLTVTNKPSEADNAAADISPATPLVASRETSPASDKTARVNGTISPAKRDSIGDRSLVRVLGLKLGRVVIDAGHGGHDTGTIGPSGLTEKDLVLDVALRLGKLITQQLGAEVIYTRSGDVFIPLEERTKIANEAKADLFISIHANSSPEPSATGIETFYFNLTSDKVGLDIATRENAGSASSISDLNDLLHKAVLENKLEESREFAQKVQTALWSTSLRINSHSKNRGVRQAPFVVLIGASMPSILAEIGFVSNPHDERLLRRPDQRQKIAEALFKGISQYAATLSHVQMAKARAQ
jgi:N-acetylmuramoyl-L-alanine amidase